jgi:hypothetical protein
MSLDQAPVSSQHVRIKLNNLANIPERVIGKMQIVTRVDRNDRASTTVHMPQEATSIPSDEWQLWWKEIHQALLYLEGADSGIPFAGVSQTFEVTWDGICRPI